LNEFDSINRFTKSIGRKQPYTKLGVGDDAAVLSIPAGKELLVSVDTMVEGVHFFADTPAEFLAKKLLAVNLSDIAAMGGMPMWATIALTAPELDSNWLAEFSSGLNSAANEAGVELIGGDTTKGALCVTLQIMGLVQQGAALTRGGASKGDDVYVSGWIGDSGLGLGLLSGSMELKGDGAQSVQDILVKRHLLPTARFELGKALVGFASSCIDVSDGLFADLGHIAEQSSVAIELALDKLPLSSAFCEVFPRQDAQRAIEAGSSGEDYELAFTAPAEYRKQIENLSSGECPITRIGSVRDDLISDDVTGDSARGQINLSFQGESIELPDQLGFDHFSNV